MKVAILGCGPAGMFAAHAAYESGAEVSIFSKNRKSHMRGAQYLHRPIPGLSGEPFTIDYRFEGEIDGYRKKVYGDMSDVVVSPETLVGVADAWDIREAYDEAWDQYSHFISDYNADDDRENGFSFLRSIMEDHDVVISTIPARTLCTDESHRFNSTKIWSTDFVKAIGIFGEEPKLDNIVVCSGFEDDWWYRQSRIHGWENTEYPFNRMPPAKSVWAVDKPVDNTCDCFPQILRQGRYGVWRKGVLSHESYYNTVQTLESLKQGAA